MVRDEIRQLRKWYMMGAIPWTQYVVHAITALKQHKGKIKINRYHKGIISCFDEYEKEIFIIQDKSSARLLLRLLKDERLVEVMMEKFASSVAATLN